MKRNETVVSSVLWVYVVLMMSVVVIDNGELHKLWGLVVVNSDSGDFRGTLGFRVTMAGCKIRVVLLAARSFSTK
jgi:hypothetical protein